MKDYLDISERIDKYILGKMTDSEKIAFEKELGENSDLNNEYQLQKEIALATQRFHFRRHIESVEGKLQIMRRNRIRKLWRCSIAAAMIGICILGLDLKYSSQVKATSLACYEIMDAPVTRSGSTVDAMINEIYQALGDREHGEIETNIANVLTIINESLTKPVISEEDRYTHEVLLMQKQDIEWYNALLLMKQGKVIKSRKALRNIASAEGRYAAIAKQILENDYPF